MAQQIPKITGRAKEVLQWMTVDIFPKLRNTKNLTKANFRNMVLLHAPKTWSLAIVHKTLNAVWGDGKIRDEYMAMSNRLKTVDDVQIRFFDPPPVRSIPGAVQAKLPMVSTFAGLRCLNSLGEAPPPLPPVEEQQENPEEEDVMLLEEEEAADELDEEYDYELADQQDQDDVFETRHSSRKQRRRLEREAVLMEKYGTEMSELYSNAIGVQPLDPEEAAIDRYTDEDGVEVSAVERDDVNTVIREADAKKTEAKALLEKYEAALKKASNMMEQMEGGLYTEDDYVQLRKDIGKELGEPEEVGADGEGVQGHQSLLDKLSLAEVASMKKGKLSKKEKKRLKKLEEEVKARHKRARKATVLKEAEDRNRSAKESKQIMARRKQEEHDLDMFQKEVAARDLAMSMIMDPIDNWRELSTQGLCVPRMVPTVSDQSFLIGEQVLSRGFDRSHSMANAPLLTDDVIIAANDGGITTVPQFSLIGTTSVGGEAKRLFTNANVPLSAFICGLQGSGKSHTLSCMLENFMVPEPKLGCLQKPLPGLVFQFSPHTHSAFKPCEAGFLGKPPLAQENLPTTVRSVRSVRILVSASNYSSMRKAYSSIPEASVSALRFRPKDLTIGSMLQLMAVGSTSDSKTPLYMHRVTQILRDMATENEGAFDYDEFKQRLSYAGFQKDQSNMLRMRLDLLESFLGDDETSSQFSVEPGVLTLVDLSCPFVDPETACALFSICLDFYLTASGDQGKNRGLVVALDEAHKYITNTQAAQKFTDSLLSLIRMQRHYGARVLISTQEPTVSPRLLDLCSMTVCHRFTSPEWFRTLRRHVNVADEDREQVFNRILDLNVGQALVFAPTAVVKTQVADDGSIDGVIPEQRVDIEEEVFEEERDENDSIGSRRRKKMKKGKMNLEEMEEKGIFEMYVRKRITFDGGKSIVSMDENASRALEDLQEAEERYAMSSEEEDYVTPEELEEIQDLNEEEAVGGVDEGDMETVDDVEEEHEEQVQSAGAR